MLAKGGDGVRVERDLPAAAVSLRLRQSGLVVDESERLTNREPARLKVERRPGEPENFATAQARRCRETPSRGEAFLVNMIKEASELAGRPRLWRCPRGCLSRRVGPISDVANEPVPTNGVRECFASSCWASPVDRTA
jgi:hypothetical protein